MKKNIIMTLFISIITISFCSALNLYTTADFEYSFDTNKMSNPLPIFDDGPYGDKPGYQWLKYKQQHPFIEKHSLGFNISMDIFIHDHSRVGLSLALATKFPIMSTSTVPTPENIDLGFGGAWNYLSYNSISTQKTAVFGSIGPIFKAQFGLLDLGIAIRLSIGGYDYIDSEVILGLQAEPYINIFLGSDLYLSTKLTYNAHFLRLISDDVKRFDEYYQMVSISPAIGIGYKF